MDDRSESSSRDGARVAGHRATAARIGEGKPESVLVLAHDGSPAARWRMIGAHLDHGHAVEQWKAQRVTLKARAAVAVWERGHVVRYVRSSVVASTVTGKEVHGLRPRGRQ